MNTVKITVKKLLEVCGVIAEMNQVILFLLIQNLLKYKRNIQENTYKVGADEADYDANKVGKNETKVVILLKHLSNFWRSLNIPLINCEVELILTRSKYCVLADMTTRDAESNNPAIVSPTGFKFEIACTKLYVPVVTLSKENEAKLLEQLNSGFERTIKWNK